MIAKVEISKTLLRDLLDEIEHSARITHASYERKTKTWPWNDQIWRRADPHRFKLVQKARRALEKKKASTP